jgi:methanogenic corrinoid protein MtbC1
VNNKEAQAIRQHLDLLADKVIAEFHKADPSAKARYSDEGWLKCRQDIVYHLNHFSAALDCECGELFCDYMEWSGYLFAALHLPENHLLRSIDLIALAVAEQLRLNNLDDTNAMRLLGEGKEALIYALHATALERGAGHENEEPFAAYLEQVLLGNRAEAMRVVDEFLHNGQSIRDLYLDIFQPSQYRIGELWHLGKISVAQEHYVTALTQTIMTGLYPRLFAARGKRKKGVLVAACAPGELHEIGLRMVTDLLEMEGWDTYYLGANLPARGVREELIRLNADLVCLSATIIPHVPVLSEIISEIRLAPKLANLKVMVGGRPFNLAHNLWSQIGADGFALDASAAVSKAAALLRSK